MIERILILRGLIHYRGQVLSEINEIKLQACYFENRAFGSIGSMENDLNQSYTSILSCQSVNVTMESHDQCFAFLVNLVPRVFVPLVQRNGKRETLG